MSYLVLLVVLHVVFSINAFLIPHSMKRTYEAKNDGEDSGLPLFLTPYIESGNILEARNLSRVDFPGFSDVKSFAGFFTVNKTYDSNQFLWYFQNSDPNVNQVILWLQGGPGVSSLYGLFDENGPFQVKNGSFHLRNTYWSMAYHVIYIDNPVGAGFSFTNDTRGYCTDQTQIADHLYTTLIQFFQLFPELQKLKFYISGESYAGKYIPALGYAIHKKNPTAEIKLNLAGLIIGDGWCDPINQLQYSDYLYQIGLVDWNQKHQLEISQNKAIDTIKKENWKEAFIAIQNVLYVIDDCIGDISVYNYMEPAEDVSCDYCELLQSSSVRKAIHVGKSSYDLISFEVYENLVEDFAKSVAPWISELLDNYDILFYNGQLDIIVAYPLTVNFLRKLNFSNADEYNTKSIRNILMLLGPEKFVTIGFLKTAGHLTEAIIRNAGHMVPADQPDWILPLIEVWITGSLNETNVLQF